MNTLKDCMNDYGWEEFSTFLDPNSNPFEGLGERDFYVPIRDRKPREVLVKSVKNVKKV